MKHTHMVQLTKFQKRVLTIIEQHFKKHQESPTIEEIRDKMGLSSSRSVTQYLEALSKKGLLRRERYKGRGIVLTKDMEKGETVQLPVFASAGCGSPSVIAERTFDEFIEVASNLITGKKKANLFVIRAMGNSMNEAGIEDGDYVLVERIVDMEYEMGDTVVAIIDDSAVIKRYVRSDDLIILKPVSSDPSHRSIILGDDATYKIFGKVLRTIRIPKSFDLKYAPAY